MGTHHHLGIIVAAALAIGMPLQACADGKPGRSTSKMTAVPAKSNGSGVAVQYRVDAVPQAGVATPILLSFEGVTEAGATVRFAADAGLSLIGSAGPHALQTGQTTTLTVQVVPDADGTGYLHVFTTQHGATSATSIVVQVGKALSALPEASGLKQTPDGDKIRSMPVK